MRILPALRLVLAACCVALPPPSAAAAQAKSSADAATAAAPLPDVPSLLHSVEQHQAELDRAREEYTFRQQQQLTFYDKHGKVKRTETRVSHVFFVHGHPIETLESKNGKALSADDVRKEQERAQKDAVKYAAEPYGHADKDDVSVARLLAIVTFDKPRRTFEGGRPVIVVDFTGDPRAKTHGRNEDAIKRVHGTVWVDEQAREVMRLHAAFDQPLKIGFGLLAAVDPGSSFAFEQALVNNEAWLPTEVHGRFDGKAALFVGFHVELAIRFDQYQKFSASTTEQTRVPARR